MKNDPKRGAPAPPLPPRPAAIPRPNQDRRAALAEVASLVEDETDLTDDLVSVPSMPIATAGAVAPPLPVVNAPVAAPAPLPSAPIAAPAPERARERVSDRLADTRTSKRLPFEINVDIVSEHNFYAGLSLNISEGGLFVATHVEHPVGTRLEIRLLLPGDETPTAIMTEVRWVRPHNENADGSAGMGLRFIEVPSPILEKIAKFAQQSREPLYYED